MTLLGAAALGLLVASSAALVACGEDGVTPDCPAMPLYNVRDDAALADADVAEARAAAVDAGCLTAPGDVEPGAD
ncbi:MAG TPA: hypothetical protein VFZ53_12855 [Polyangiaceae bacterium]